MDLYDCTVNLNSKRNTQVEKREVTAAEIMILRAIHGGQHEGVGGEEPVINIKRVGTAQRSDEEERDRLIGTTHGKEDFGVALYRENVFRKVFTHDSLPLPQTLPGYEAKLSPKREKFGNLAANILKEGADEAFA